MKRMLTYSLFGLICISLCTFETAVTMDRKYLPEPYFNFQDSTKKDSTKTEKKEEKKKSLPLKAERNISFTTNEGT